MNKKFITLLSFIVFGVLCRLLPHPPNFTPITTLSLFGATKFDNKYSGIILPLLVMFISDIFLGFYSISVWVYTSFFLIGIMGRFFSDINLKSILSSSVLFFVLTNFGVWLGGYPLTVEGFILCYTLAIPFFGYSLAGNLFYGYMFKWGYEYLESKFQLQTQIA